MEAIVEEKCYHGRGVCQVRKTIATAFDDQSFFSENITPTVVIDKSNFPASSVIRERLAAAKSAGLDANTVVFNEIY